jgi:glycine cleavage system regulatory protein
MLVIEKNYRKSTNLAMNVQLFGDESINLIHVTTFPRHIADVFTTQHIALCKVSCQIQPHDLSGITYLTNRVPTTVAKTLTPSNLRGGFLVLVVVVSLVFIWPVVRPVLMLRAIT